MPGGWGGGGVVVSVDLTEVAAILEATFSWDVLDVEYATTTFWPDLIKPSLLALPSSLMAVVDRTLKSHEPLELSTAVSRLLIRSTALTTPDRFEFDDVVVSVDLTEVAAILEATISSDVLDVEYATVTFWPGLI